MNSKICYLYRDASNYKEYNEVILAGEMTPEHLRRIDACMEADLFIPRQVGLPETRITSYRTDDDGPWFEWSMWYDLDDENNHVNFDLKNSGVTLTNEKPTVNMTVDELVAAFEEVHHAWDESSWEDDYEYKTYSELFGEDECEACGDVSSEEDQFECNIRTCVFNPDGQCWFQRMYGKRPILTCDGCDCFQRNVAVDS